MRLDSSVTLTIPSEMRFVSMARVAAAGLAAEFDFSIEDIDDLRMGVNELVAVLVDAVDGRPLTLEFDVDDDGAFVVTADAPGIAFEEVADDLTLRIIRAVADGLECSDGRCTMTKRRSRS